MVAAVIAIALLYATMSGGPRTSQKTGGSSSPLEGGAGEAPRPPTPRVAARGEAPAAPAAVDSVGARPSSSTSVLFQAKWGGSSADHLGRDIPSEGNPSGPMSLSPTPGGGLVVLDQVNGRIVRRGPGGEVQGVVPLKVTEAHDVAVASDGTMAVLDRLVDRTIAVHDATGAEVGRLPLDPERVGDTGLLTGVFVDRGTVWVEREHGTLVAVGDLTGRAAAEPLELPGRPSRDGALLLSAGIVDGGAGRAFVSAIDRASMEHRFTRELRYAGVVRSIGLLDSDKQGVIYLAVTLARGDAEAVVLSCLEPSKGAPTGGNELPVSTTPEETFRDLTVLDGGGVVVARRTDEGASYERYDCR